MKKFLIGLSVILLLTIPAGFLQMAEGVYFYGKFLYQHSNNEFRLGNTYLTVYASDTDAAFSGRVFDEEVSGTMELSPGLAVFRFNDMEYTANVQNHKLIDSDNVPMNIEISTSVGGSLDDPYIQRSFANTIWNITQQNTTHRGNLINIIIGLAIAVFGLLGLIWTEEVYFFFSSWKYENPQLSDAGIWTEKIGSGILLALGLIWMYTSALL